jgi:hypothetical protein
VNKEWEVKEMESLKEEEEGQGCSEEAVVYTRAKYIRGVKEIQAREAYGTSKGRHYQKMEEEYKEDFWVV